jgi:sugar/nucleoside kinase (ribokinase family)
MTVDRPLVLVVGAASRDIVADEPRGWRLGGAASYGALALARLGLRVRAAVGVDDEASRAIELDHLRAAGVELHLVALASGPVFENMETAAGRRQRCLAIADVMAMDGLPSHWIDDLDGVFLGPVAGELDARWAAVRAPIVALGWQGLLRTLQPGTDVARRPPTAQALLAGATLVGASRDDFEPSTSPAVLAGFLAPSTTLVITEGQEGGRILRTDRDGRAGRTRRYPAIPPDRTIDPTGAGDVFLAAMLAAALGSSSGTATSFAAAAASLVVEAPGIAAVPDLEAVRARMTRLPSRASRRPSAVSSRASGRPSQA